MNFDELNALIPYAKGGKEKVLRMQPYPNVTLALPGRHAEQTSPKGGDFVVMVTDPVFNIPDHQFSHDDIFKDVELRVPSPSLMQLYFRVIKGEDPVGTDMISDMGCYWKEGTISRLTFLCAVQCLAVAEHRRYKQHEAKYGGRYLPFRAAAGIAEELWTASEASEKTRKLGRPGVEWLESERGVPKLTQELMK